MALLSDIFWPHDDTPIEERIRNLIGKIFVLLLMLGLSMPTGLWSSPSWG
jgi:hypothetical protein